jgi:hypothetical protein
MIARCAKHPGLQVSKGHVVGKTADIQFGVYGHRPNSNCYSSAIFDQLPFPSFMSRWTCSVSQSRHLRTSLVTLNVQASRATILSFMSLTTFVARLSAIYNHHAIIGMRQKCPPDDVVLGFPLLRDRQPAIGVLRRSLRGTDGFAIGFVMLGEFLRPGNGVTNVRSRTAAQRGAKRHDSQNSQFVIISADPWPSKRSRRSKARLHAKASRNTDYPIGAMTIARLRSLRNSLNANAVSAINSIAMPSRPSFSRTEGW